MRRGSVARLLRIACALGLLAAAVAAAVDLVALFRTPLGGAFVERGAAEIRAAAERALARAGGAAAIEARLAARLSEEPRDWAAIEALEALAAAEGVTIPPDLAARRAALAAEDRGLLARAGRCAACAWDLAACDLSGTFLCGLAVSLTPLGDVAALAREGRNAALGRPVDEVDVMLATLGLGATVLLPATGGGSAAVKAGAAVARSAWRMGRLAPGVAGVLGQAAREGIDWARLPAARSADDLAALVRAERIAPAVEVAGDVARIEGALGLRPALLLLGAAQSPAELRRIAAAAEALGPKTPGLLELLGRSRLLRLGLRLSDAALGLMAGLLAALGALAGLLGNAAAGALLRGLRRALQRGPALRPEPPLSRAEAAPFPGEPPLRRPAAAPPARTEPQLTRKAAAPRPGR